MATIWRRIKRHIVSGKETAKVDFKVTLDLSSKAAKTEFAKDVMAIANTPGGDGYLIIGLHDEKMVSTNPLSSRVVGFQASNGDIDALFRQMIDALNDYCNRMPVIEYDEVSIPNLHQVIGVVTIKRSVKRPHSFSKDGANIRQNDIPIRRGTKTFPMASTDEIAEMFQQASEKKVVIVINLSGHPLTEEQQSQLSNMGYYIEELIEMPAHFGEREVAPQVDTLLDQIGLTVEEWQSKRIVLLPSGLSAPSISLIARIHGLRGNFPDIIWVQRSTVHAGTFVIGEYIELQTIRDQARTIRIIQE